MRRENEKNRVTIWFAGLLFAFMLLSAFDFLPDYVCFQKESIKVVPTGVLSSMRSFKAISKRTFVKNFKKSLFVDAYFVFHDELGDTYFFVHYVENEVEEAFYEQDEDFGDAFDDIPEYLMNSNWVSIQECSDLDLLGTISKEDFERIKTAVKS
ncbi:MAG: hypothetical protein IJM43_03780 [Bacteroidaceae bacterium]|nr:hypothetical protein [Bacteroidaceae bacterium]